MLKLGLLGRSIKHSRSKEMYEKILGEAVDYHLLDYDTYEEIPRIKDFFAQGFLGLSITYPFKQSFIDQVVIKDEVVKKIGAINCMKSEGEHVFATNTDYLAAKEIVKTFTNSEFLILGSGNMSNVFKIVFEELNLPYKVLCRKSHGDLNLINYDNYCSNELKTVLINCCSREFIFNSKLPSNVLFWDMNYSFSPHNHLMEADFDYREGIDLLSLQASFALSFWNIRPI